MKIRTAVLVTATLLVMALTACGPSPSTSAPPAPCPQELGVYDGWYAAGDSAFAGVGWQYRGAPSFIDGMSDRSYPGDTLVKLKAPHLASQPTVMARISAAFCRDGVVPRNIIIHAGAADLIARQEWNQRYAFGEYTNQFHAINTWLTTLGIERIVWTTAIPMTSWARHAPENQFRLQLNDWLRASGLEVLDCEPALANEFGWLPTELSVDSNKTVKVDGAHLNEQGARLHAQCIIDGLGDPSLSLKE